MDEAARRSLEERIARFRQDGQEGAAAEAVVLGYGPEILGWLVAVLSSDVDAGDVFGMFSEEVCRGIGRFRGESSARTWAYAVARNCKRRHLSSPARRREIALTPSLAGELEWRVRTGTHPYQRTEVKDRLSAIRDGLDPEDRSLLVLRVDRGMAWEEIARVLDDDAEHTPESARRRATALRKRFQRLKEELRLLARQHGLVE